MSQGRVSIVNSEQLEHNIDVVTWYFQLSNLES